MKYLLRLSSNCSFQADADDASADDSSIVAKLLFAGYPCDRNLRERFRLSGLSLMENSGLRVRKRREERYPHVERQ